MYKFLLFLPRLQILRLRIFQAGISDEILTETVTKLKEATSIELVLLSQTKLLCYQTNYKQIDKIISDFQTNTVNHLQITKCHIAENLVIKTIFDKCSTKLQIIDFTGSSIKDEGLCGFAHIPSK